MKLQKSPIAILNLMKTKEVPMTSQDIGDVLYETTSKDLNMVSSRSSWYKKEIARAWASRILNGLKKKGLVDSKKITDCGHTSFWFLTEEGKKYDR